MPVLCTSPSKRSSIYLNILNKILFNFFRSLQGTCNILIAMECVFAMFLDVNYFASFGLVISGIRFIPYGQCFPFVATMSIFANLSQFTMLLTGLDRLFAVLFPMWLVENLCDHLHNGVNVVMSTIV